MHRDSIHTEIEQAGDFPGGFRFRDELKAQQYHNLVNEHFRRGVQDGVYGTPGLFINGIRYAGALDFDTLRARILNSGRGT